MESGVAAVYMVRIVPIPHTELLAANPVLSEVRIEFIYIYH